MTSRTLTGRVRARTGAVAATVAALAVLAVGAAPANAGSLLSTTVSAESASARDCIGGVLRGASVVQRSVTAPSAGWVTARLDASSGDWDLAIFDSATGDRVAGSAFFGASEVAQGFVAGGERLTVQACRRSGDAKQAKLTVDSTAVAVTEPETLSLVRVSTPTPARKRELTSLGLDLTEHGRAGFVEVVLHGADDAKRLRDAKFTFVTEIANLAQRSAADRRADRSFRAGTAKSALPSGRDSYRSLADYGQEMKTLAAQNPGLVKPITLPFKTWTGMSVEGIEISNEVNARDGKPVFLQMGAHHAREWPSAEHAMEWAYELVNGAKGGNARVKRLLDSTRTIVVPIINPEGFNTSREAASAMDDGRGGPDETPNLAFPYEYQRKNCRVNNPDGDDPPEGDCTQLGQPNVGLSQFGVDPNRNYGGFWGGPGASAGGPAPFGDFAQDYRGSAPFSEPETRNVRALVSGRQVTTLITNHTFSNLLLRPPGIQAKGPSFDETVYKALGDAMAAKNGYASQLSYQLYDTTGTTEDWTYTATGGLGFTFEIGPGNFHPSYAGTVAEYEGTTAGAANRGGNREAYFTALESTANASRHSVIEGGAPAGAVLRLKKSFKTSTSPVEDADGVAGAAILFDDTLETTLQVPASGAFQWHVNPSTRPGVAQGEGRPATGGAPSPKVERLGQPASQPPCPTYFEAGPETCVAGGVTDEQFEVPANSPSVDNGFATIRLGFPDEADMDLEIYKADADGNATGDPISSSAGGDNPEETTIGPDPAPGKYVARVVNYSGGSLYDLTITFSGPKPFKPGGTESWTLTCEVGGQVRATQAVTIKRGERKPVSFGSACPAPAAAASRCVSTRGGVKSSSVGQAKLGRKRSTQRRRLRVRRVSARNGIDRYCVQGGGSMRVGYPTKRLNAKLSATSRKRYSSKAIFAVSTSKKFKLRRLKVGSRTKTLRKRLKGERSFRIGKKRWYTVAGSRSRLVFSTRRGKVRELGLASKRLTSTRRGTVRLLRAWDRRG